VTKGIREFAAAARALHGRARFVVAGEHDRDSGKAIPDDEFNSWVRDGIIEYAGMRSDIREVYRAADIVCLPSWGGEGVPKALIEAASSALPVVTTDVPGCRDIVRHGVNGLIVPPRDVEALTNALRTLIDDGHRRREMGKRGREIVIGEFSLRDVVHATLALYAQLSDETPLG
jgi:glycosyltransferase involved in cell wall biosynthesis